jgi:hypothetical protein
MGSTLWKTKMYRVVVVKLVTHGSRRMRVISKGPLHPDAHTASRWAELLRSVGHYHEVKVETFGQTSSANFNVRD